MATGIQTILSLFGQSVILVKPTETTYGGGYKKRVYGEAGATITIALQKQNRKIIQDVEGQEHTVHSYATFDTDLDVDERDMFILESGEKFIVFKGIRRNDNMNNNFLRHVRVDLEIYSE